MERGRPFISSVSASDIEKLEEWIESTLVLMLTLQLMPAANFYVVGVTIWHPSLGKVEKI